MEAVRRHDLGRRGGEVFRAEAPVEADDHAAVRIAALQHVLRDGLRLDLACRVTTKPSDNGKYLNVDKVLPVGTKVPKGGGDDNNIPY